jgi:hypothetical protein
MRMVAANRRELWVSMAVVAFGLFFASVPVTFDTALILSAVMVVAFICAFNAILDLDEMGVVETYVAVLWFIALAIMTPLTLYWMASIHEFANK